MLYEHLNNENEVKEYENCKMNSQERDVYYGIFIIKFFLILITRPFFLVKTVQFCHIT